MISMNFKSNIKDFTRHLDKVQKKQIPFATARALTWTAQDAQKAIIRRIQAVFQNRKKWWLKQQPTGVKIKSATKKYLVAKLYTLAHWGPLQESGGTKHPKRSKNLIIPTDKVPKSRRQSGGAKKMLDSSKNVFSTAKGIYRRKGGKKRKNQTVELLFHKDKTAEIKPRFEFKETAAKTAIMKFKKNFYKSLASALKTIK